MGAIRVFVVDDHVLFTDTIVEFINDQEGLEVVGTARLVREAITELTRLRPDVLLTDIRLRDESGLSLVRRVTEGQLGVRSVVVTGLGDPGLLRASFAAGAAGFVEKLCPAAELLTAIREVHRGRPYVCSTARLPDELVEPASKPLAPREVEVVRLVAFGYTNREIAARLHVSVKTVEGYRKDAMDKLGLSRRRELVVYALETGLAGPAVSVE